MVALIGRFPVKLQRFLQVDAAFLNSMSYEDKEMMFFIFGEREQNFLYPTISAHYQRRISQSVVVMDFKKVSLLKTYYKLKEMFKVTSKVLSDYYPETMRQMIIINTGTGSNSRLLLQGNLEHGQGLSR